MLKLAIAAARAAADVIRQGITMNGMALVEQKQRSDYVTQTDRAAEQMIIKIIKSSYPGHGIFAEESQKDRNLSCRWLIDPLDGTTNFIHKVPVFSISIALEYFQEIVIAVIYDITRDELFYAEKGKGAFLNDSPIHVSTITNLEHALLGTGFPFKQKDKINLYLQSFAQLFDQVSAIRRMGSAAIDLAYVACGRFDGFWEIGLSPWDLAAGSLLISEAGGLVTDFSSNNQHIWTGNVIAANRALYPGIAQIIRNVFQGTIDA